MSDTHEFSNKFRAFVGKLQKRFSASAEGDGEGEGEEYEFEVRISRVRALIERFQKSFNAHSNDGEEYDDEARLSSVRAFIERLQRHTHSNNGEEYVVHFTRARGLVEKLQRRFNGGHYSNEVLKIETLMSVADDVKEGQFAVWAVKGLEKKRFVVNLECLNNSEFLQLLEEAEQEYGFEQSGTLVVPCRPHELQKILQI